MIIPPLNRITNSTFNIGPQKTGRLLDISSLSSVKFGAAHPRIVRGYYSEPGDLTFNYSIISYTKRSLKFQFYFDKPLQISKNIYDPEYLEIYFYGNFLFFDTDGLFL